MHSKSQKRFKRRSISSKGISREHQCIFDESELQQSIIDSVQNPGIFVLDVFVVVVGHDDAAGDGSVLNHVTVVVAFGRGERQHALTVQLLQNVPVFGHSGFGPEMRHDGRDFVSSLFEILNANVDASGAKRLPFSLGQPVLNGHIRSVDDDGSQSLLRRARPSVDQVVHLVLVVFRQQRRRGRRLQLGSTRSSNSHRRIRPFSGRFVSLELEISLGFGRNAQTRQNRQRRQFFDDDFDFGIRIGDDGDLPVFLGPVSALGLGFFDPLPGADQTIVDDDGAALAESRAAVVDDRLWGRGDP